MKTTSLLFLCLFIFPGLSWATTLSFKGEAKNDKGELVYIENHLITMNAQGLVDKVTTTYNRPSEDRPFAKLESWFDRGYQTIPRTRFQDFRNQTEEVVTFENNGQTLVITHKDLNRDRSRSQRTKVTENMVHGQGYHNLIVRDFSEFEQNPTRTLDFVVPSRQTSYRFGLTYLGVDSESSLASFRLDISNWFLRLFADKIIVRYDPETKRLMSYEGLTNIQSDQGENQSLTITMIYPADSLD